MSDKQLLLAFYGDDFTGSTDALEFISRAGMKAVLFIEPPSADQLNVFEDLDAIGVAGMSRSLTPDAMEDVLRPSFERLKELQPRHVHYKVCSTFDSSPTIGSIGQAIDVGAKVFESRVVPVLVAAPQLGRYCVFGNLFARMGIGSNGEIFRLDRHPSMSKHPVTPADESDLVVHLGKQTQKKIGLLNILQLEKSCNELKTAFDKIADDGAEVIMIDGLEDDQLLKIGALLDERASDSTLLSVGSSGVEMALGKCWNERGVIEPVQEWPKPKRADKLLVLSGSCSPVTTAQLHWALANGFKEVEIDVSKIMEENDELQNNYSRQAVEFFNQGYDVVVHTGGGKRDAETVPGEVLGTSLGKIGLAILQQVSTDRLVIAGGDTSSYAARALGIDAVEMIAPLLPGAPLCKAYSKDKVIDGMEVNFKGGQVGGEDYFGVLKRGELRVLPRRH